MTGSHIFGKDSCPHCLRAKDHLDQAGIENRYYDVVKDTRALYEMLARVKPIIGPKTPVTLPQIWIDGQYVGGAEALKEPAGPRPSRAESKTRASPRCPPPDSLPAP